MRILLGTLTTRERDIVNARFGFDRPTETLAQIGERSGISTERVRQIEAQALAKLRQGGGSPPARPRTPGKRATPTNQAGQADQTPVFRSSVEGRMHPRQTA
jgi:hypothetical protein